LMAALKKNKKANAYFMDFSKSSKKIIFEWIYNAKQEGTRKMRIDETVPLAAKNIRVNHYQQPKKID